MKKKYFFKILSKRCFQSIIRQLVKVLIPPLILTFSGNIGVGKTTLIRILLKNMGIRDKVVSPTFSIVESYQNSMKNINIYHFDFYRINNICELDNIEIMDYLLQNSVCCIEWPEVIYPFIKKYVDLNFVLSLYEWGRLLSLQCLSKKGEIIMSKLGFYL
ncbi:tRNA (adenosine(37)-N6)-threonylcarbamoyltransferase complex ATPase subunit type 1 TsaE [Candidatus Legionella polyplacis]|uniref:tRNA threonylcarbamoyladenosine biosynthesis protein TsaE n=1 Tax=Candidatus Legionella polyplacis TaxID=2005262 RepID=A0ABZ2H190_9GAMM